MKRRDFETMLKNNGYYLLKLSKHRVWGQGVVRIPVPHHSDLNRFLVDKMIKQYRLTA